MPIGEIARRTGLKVPTIRYYEQIGLLAAPARSEGNRRCYGNEEQNRLIFIRHARELGFEIEAIRRLLALQDRPEKSCGQVDALVAEHLSAIDARIARLTALRQELKRMLAECGGGRVAECRVIESIAKCDCLSAPYEEPAARHASAESQS
jgi:DNA-binding transcriptional MerR regulator